MYLENDYREEKETRSQDGLLRPRGVEMEGCQEPEEELQYYLEYSRVRESQFTCVPSEQKEQRLVRLYDQLKEAAFLSSGKISLTVDETRMRATLVCWSPCLFITEVCNEPVRDILGEIIRDSSMICIEAVGEGVQMTLEEELYDEVMVTDRSRELEEILQKIKSMKRRKDG